MKKVNKLLSFMLNLSVVFIALLFNIVTAQALSNVPVEDGIYMFYSKLDSDRVMDIAGASLTPGTNVQLWEYNGCTAQQFEVKRWGDWYTIKSVCSGLALDVQGASTESGTNVWQWHVNGHDAQKWQFCDAGDGYYYVRSKIGNNMLDVCGADKTKGTNIQVYFSNNNDAQKWRLQRVPSVSVEDGTYMFYSKLDGNGNRVMDVAGASLTPGTNIQSWEYNGCTAQQFEVKRSEDWYTIKSVCSGLALDVQGASTESGANVWQWHVNGHDAQKWQFYDTGDGYYYVRSKIGSNMLDICGADKAKGTNIQVYMFNGNDAQKWRLQKISGSWQYPMENYRVSQGFAHYSKTMAKKGRAYHSGIDMVSSDKIVRAAADGKVIYKGGEGSNGNHIILSHNLNGQTVKTLYSHLESYKDCPNVGETVSAGKQIGVMGSTGNSSGSHLHFGVFTGSSNNPYGYTNSNGKNRAQYGNVTFYNPDYVIKYNKLP